MKVPIRSACFALALAAPSLAQITTRVSVATGGFEGNAESFAPTLSSTCRFIAFYSEASNLVAGDANGADDVFVRDQRTRKTTRVSVDSSGVEGDGDSYDPSISADGRYVAFYSEASNLVPGDTNGASDCFLHDRATGLTTCISVAPNGLPANAMSVYPSLSADGRFVAFHSWASDLVAGDTNAREDVFVRDLATGTTIRASVGAGGVQGDSGSEYGSLSADGSFVAFVSSSTNLVSGDTNGTSDVFVRDLLHGTTTRVSVDSNGAQGNAGCSYPSISGDGHVVGFESWSNNLVANDANGFTDSFVHDLTSGVTSLVSVSTSGVQGNQLSLRARLSFDGRFVAFKSQASNLVAGDTNGAQDIFLRDRLLGTTRRVNVSTSGQQSDYGANSQPTISADGRHVAFYSSAGNLVPNDTNGVADVFIR